jgi:hypothetical protein
MRESTRARVRRVLALTEQGWSPAAIAEQEGVSDSYVRMLLSTARAEGPASESAPVASPGSRAIGEPTGKRISDHTLLHRAWIALHLDRRLWTMDNGKRLLWLECVATIHRVGDAEGLLFGRYGDGFESRAEFAAAHGGTETDLEALFRRGLLLALENGGIAIPPGLGLRPWGKGPSAVALPALPPRAATIRRAEKGPVPGQRTFVMGMPSADPAVSTANFAASSVGADANICADTADAGANICVAGSDDGAKPCVVGENLFLVCATSTSTQEKNSLEGSSSGTGTRATDANFQIGENLRGHANLCADGSLLDDAVPGVPDGPGAQPVWVSLATELSETAGRKRPVTSAEAAMVRAWMDDGADADLIRGAVSVMMSRGGFPSDPSLKYFEGAVRDALKAAKRREAVLAKGVARNGAKTAPDSASAAIDAQVSRAEEWAEPELAAQWARVRSRLKSEVTDGTYHAWLRRMTLAGIAGHEVLVNLPSRFVRDRVSSEFGVRLEALWRDENAEVRRVELGVAEAQAAALESPPQIRASG